MNTTECPSSPLDNLPSSVLATRLDELISRERQCLADFLLHLAAFDRRRGYLELGFGSLFAFCTDSLKMAGTTAYRRTTSARLIAEYPAIVEYVRDGRISTKSLCDLRNVLNKENHQEILERAARMTEKEIEVLAATLNPKAAVADSIRRLPVRAVPVLRPVMSRSTSGSESAEHPVPPAASPIESSTLESFAATSLGAALPPASVADEASGMDRLEQTWIIMPPKPDELVPLDGERYSIRMTVSKEFVDEFHQVRDALSHVVRGGKMEDVFRECMRIARETCERRMRGSKSRRARQAGVEGSREECPEPPAAEAPTSTVEVASDSAARATTEASLRSGKVMTTSIMEVPDEPELYEGEPSGSRYLPVAVRREVFERDERCCTFVGSNGRRCRSRRQLQFHHKIPYARGGPPTAENVALLCARHNLHQAYVDYGAAYMDHFVAPQS